MSQIKYADSVNIEWETVRNKKDHNMLQRKKQHLRI